MSSKSSKLIFQTTSMSKSDLNIYKNEKFSR